MAKPLPEHMQCSPCLKIRKFRQSCVMCSQICCSFISHANEIFWILLMQVEYLGCFSYKWNILDISYANEIFLILFMQLKISLKYAVNCS